MEISDHIIFDLEELVDEKVFTHEYKLNFLTNQILHCLETLDYKEVHQTRKEQEDDDCLEHHENDYPVHQLEKVNIERFARSLSNSPIERNNETYGDTYMWTWREYDFGEYRSAEDLDLWEDDYQQIFTDPLSYISCIWALEVYRSIPEDEREPIDCNILAKELGVSDDTPF